MCIYSQISTPEQFMGDVVGPASAVNDNFAAFDGTTGKLIKDSGYSASDFGDVVGPGVAVAGNIATYDGTTGKLIQDSGVSPSDFGDVVGPGSAVSANFASYNGVTGKIIQDSGYSADSFLLNSAAIIEDFDDFISDMGNNTALSKLNWRNSSTGGATTEGTGTADHPGIITLTVTSTGTQMIDLGDIGILLGGGEWIINFWLRIPTLSDGTDTFVVQFGFGDGALGSSTPTDGVYWRYTHSENSGAWTINTISNGTPTNANTASTVNTNWNKYTIIVNAAATSCAFYINDVQVTNSPIATTIPTGTGRETGIFIGFNKTAGSTLRSVDCDLYTYKHTLTNPRT